MRRTRAAAIAQRKACGAAFGMPREAIALGAADLVPPPGRIAAAPVKPGVRARAG